MFGKLKYLFLYCYEASEKMETKANIFAEERKKRMEDFRTEHKEAQDKAKAKLDEVRTEVKKQIKETLNNVGVATKDEVGEIKKLLTDLTKKVDTLAKK